MQKPAFYDNSRLYFNAVQIFARAIRFVPPPLENNWFSYDMSSFDPEKKISTKNEEKTNYLKALPYV